MQAFAKASRKTSWGISQSSLLPAPCTIVALRKFHPIAAKGIFDASRNRAIAQLAVNKPGLPGCRFFHIGMNGDIDHQFGIELLGVNSRRQKPRELHGTILL